jgi:two-component system OmpR family response regulator
MTATTELRVLLVEDNTHIAQSLTRLAQFASEPLTIHCVGRLDMALTEASTNLFDAVLLDLNLPDSRGRQTLRMLCAAAPSLPILVFDGEGIDESAAVADGACGVVQKDIDIDELVVQVRRALR